MKNIFDRLHNEKLQIAQRKKNREEFEQKLNSNENQIKKQNKKLSLKELLLSDQIKELYKINSPKDNNIENKNEVWPKNLKNNYLDKFIYGENNESLSPIKNLNFNDNEESKNDFFE